VYEACDLDHCGTEDQRLDCVIDKAFVNLGAMMAERVDGGASNPYYAHSPRKPLRQLGLFIFSSTSTTETTTS